VQDAKGNYSTSTEDKLSPVFPTIRNALSMLHQGLISWLNVKIHKELGYFIKGKTVKRKTLEHTLVCLELRVPLMLRALTSNQGTPMLNKFWQAIYWDIKQFMEIDKKYSASKINRVKQAFKEIKACFLEYSITAAGVSSSAEGGDPESPAAPPTGPGTVSYTILLSEKELAGILKTMQEGKKKE